MATSIIMSSTSLLVFLVGLLASVAQARPFRQENSSNKLMMIIMFDDIGSSTTATEETTSVKGKVAPSPPSPTSSSPPIQQGTINNYPAPKPNPPIIHLLPASSRTQENPYYNTLISMVTSKFQKTPKSPPSPKPAPSKHQGTIRQPIQQQRSSPPTTVSGKTPPKSPPSPKPAPSEHQGIFKLPTQQITSAPDIQIASV